MSPPTHPSHARARRASLVFLLALAACDAGGSSPRTGSDGDPSLPPGEQPAGEDPSVSEPEPTTPTKPVKPLKTTPESFESDIYGSTASGGPGGAQDAGTAAPGAGDFASPPGTGTGIADYPSAPGDAERAIAEADVVQTAGDTLYALSRVAGLTVIDLADVAHPRVLGRYRALPGTPFEMYLKDGVVLAMYSSYGEYVLNAAGGYDLVQVSKVVALDVSRPATISQLGDFDVTGEISDSRLVGDILYVVAYQNGYCWGCTTSKPQTTVLSLDVSAPRAVKKVDELAFADGSNQSWGKRSISVNTQRMYVGGPEYGSDQPTGSTIQVVDISDPKGDMVPGTSVRVAGMITSRWQMDEHEGVLRVISQPSGWWFNNGSTVPTVQTYQVRSAQSLSLLGRLDLVIPQNDQLQTVRFDGTRAYAVTAQRVDPLITIDLSLPAWPRQLGELHMPGALYYLEPRGDRVIGLGYDRGNPDGGITVSVFDVSNLATPRMLDRVNFGGAWASLPEDQDRIQKAFKILDDRQLALVPFSGWGSWDPSRNCATPYRSGIQLVDLKGDDLTLRGVVPSRGEARRALIHRDALLAVSDEAVDSFDITNRDRPSALGTLTVARNVSRVLDLGGDVIARINEDWYVNQNSSLDFVGVADVASPDVSLGTLSLADALAEDPTCSGYTYVTGAFARAGFVNLTFSRWRYDAAGGGYNEEGIVTVDARNPARPVVSSRLYWASTSYGSGWYGYWPGGLTGYVQSQLAAQRTDTAYVRLEQRWDYDSTSGKGDLRYRMRVVDLRDPARPSASVLELPTADGYSGLVVDGDDVLLSHHVPSADGRRSRFYVNRVSLADPQKPVLGPDVNVPGALLEYDSLNQRGLYTDLVRSDLPDLTAAECYERYGWAYFEYPVSYTDPNDVRGTCSTYKQRIQLGRFVPGGAVRDDQLTLADDERISATSVGGGRALVSLGYQYGGYWYGGYAMDCWGYCARPAAAKPSQVLTLAGFDTGTFVSGRLTVERAPSPWWGFWGSPSVYAQGTRGLVIGEQDALVLDLADASAPAVLRTEPLFGYPNDLTRSGARVLIAEGMQGVQRIDL